MNRSYDREGGILVDFHRLPKWILFIDRLRCALVCVKTSLCMVSQSSHTVSVSCRALPRESQGHTIIVLSLVVEVCTWRHVYLKILTTQFNLQSAFTA